MAWTMRPTCVALDARDEQARYASIARRMESYALPPTTAPSTSSSNTTIGTADTKAWADSAPQMFDRACTTLLWTEMARTLAASTSYQTRRANDLVSQLQLHDPGPHLPPPLSTSDEAEMARSRMAAVGRHVGANLIERLTRDRARLTDALDRVKFICKDLWMTVWEKQMDNLRTNHRGVFVLQDHGLRSLSSLRASDASQSYVTMHLAYAEGLIHGALERLGVTAHVQAEMDTFPGCAFHIRLVQPSSSSTS